MRRAPWIAVVLVVPFAAGGACSSTSNEPSDCTCTVGASKFACATTDCIDGELWACSSTAQLDDRGTCTTNDAGSAGGSDSGSAPGDDAAPPDTSCSDLATFCDTHCQSNATAYADCTRTAQQNDALACSTWQASSSSSCP